MEVFLSRINSPASRNNGHSSHIQIKSSTNRTKHSSIKLICYMFLVTVSTSYSANAQASENFQLEKLHSGDTHNIMLQASQRIHQLISFQTDPTIRKDIVDVVKLLSSLTDVLESSKEWNTQNSNVPLFNLNNVVSAVASDVLNTRNKGKSSARCVNDLIRVIEGLTNRTSWANQMLDASGKPGPSLLQGRFQWVGNYRQCRDVGVLPDRGLEDPGFRGAYTVISLGILTNASQTVALKWGLCLPDSCNEGQIQSLLNQSVTFANLTSSLVVNPVEIRTDVRELTVATAVSIAVLAVLGILLTIGTAIDVIKRRHLSTYQLASQSVTSNTKDEDNGYDDETKPLVAKTVTSEQSTLLKVVLAFSIYTNTSKFLNTSQSAGSLGAIHGIRFFSMSWVILGHTYVFGAAYFDNSLDLLQQLQHWTFDGIANALVSVDTFFTLSGLLTAYITILKMRTSGWRINWGLFYFHRFWRLTPPYMLSVLLVLGLQRFFGGGALWPDVMPVDKVQCEENWWKNLLYINNLFPVNDMCFGHSWYLSNDMQFFLISPLMLVPFYFHKTVGLVTCLVILTAHWVTTFTMSYTDQWPAAIITTIPSPGTLSYLANYYFKPWCRIGPFVIGVATGYFLAVYRGRLPLSRTLNAIGWLVSVAVGLGVVYGLHGDIGGASPSSVFVDSLYNAFARTAWGACVCWVIASCSSGYGGPVNRLLSWSLFIPLGRLTYMAYLIHPAVLSIYYSNMDQLFYFNNLNIIISYLGVLFMTNMVAFVLMLGLESPMIGLERVLITKKRE